MINLTPQQMQHFVNVLAKAPLTEFLADGVELKNVRVSPHGNVDVEVVDFGQTFHFGYCNYSDQPEFGRWVEVDY